MATLSHISTPLLDIAYHSWGDPSGKPVVLVHGYPDDAQGWQPAAEILASNGYYAIAPYLRGYGKTKFLSDETPRTAQQADLALDMEQFLDALGLHTVSFIGHDWGGRSTAGFAAMHPKRVRSITALTGYLLYNSEAGNEPEPPERESPKWYQWYFQTARGKHGIEKNRREIGKLLWQQWSPSWKFTDEEFNRVADSWETPEFPALVIHSYRHRYGNAPTNPDVYKLEEFFQKKPKIDVPAAVVFGAEDPLEKPEDWAKQSHLWPQGKKHVIEHAGHFMHHEKPAEVAAIFLELDRLVE